MNYVLAIRLANNLLVEKMIQTGPGKYTIDGDGDYGGIIAAIYDPQTISNLSLDNVQNVVIDNVPYTKADSQSEYDANVKTYLWNQSKKQLDIHMPNNINVWSIQNFVVGVSIASYKTNLKHDQWNGESNGIKYKNNLKKTPAFNDTFDDVYNGKMSLPDSFIVLENNDGLLSRLNEDDNYLNRQIIVDSWYSEGLYDYDVQLEQEKVGVVTSIVSGPDIVINFKDARDIFKESSPIRDFDLTIWTDCSDSFPIPERWGPRRRIKAKCINELDEVGTVWKFPIADVTYNDVHALTAVYDQGVKLAVTPSIQYFDDVAYFEVDKEDVSGNTNICFDCEGYEDNTSGELIEKATDIIKEKILILQGKEYNALYYDTSEWAEAAALCSSIGFDLEERMVLRDQIEMISASSLGRFNIVGSTGKFSYEIIGASLATQMIIDETRFIPSDDRNTIEYDDQKIIPAVSIGWNYRQDNDRYSLYTDRSKVTELDSLIYNSDPIVKNTLIMNYADAQKMAKLMLFLFGRKLRKVVKTVWMNAQNRLLKSGQFVTFQFDRDGFNLGYRRCFILDINREIDETKNKIQLTITVYMQNEDLSGYKIINQLEDGEVVTYQAIVNQNGTIYDQYVIQ